MEQVILYGNGRVASSVYLRLTHDSPYEIIAFTVDQEYIKEDALHNLPVVPFEKVESIYSPDEYGMHIAVGYVRVNRIRAERYYQAQEKGYRLLSYINSKANTWPGLIIGDNCRIGTCTISPMVEIGNNVSIASGSTVGHHTVLKDHCSLANGVIIAGTVTVESYCVIGANATIRDRVTIARECIIGAGAVILEDTVEKGVYMSKPADRLPITSDKLPLG